MKKTWTVFCAAALVALSLTGCASEKTQDDRTDPSPAAGTQLSTRSIHGTAGSGDLAGADGVVGTRHDPDPLKKAGEDVRDTLDKAGDGVRNAVDRAGDAARDAGRDAKNMIEGK